MSETWKVGFEDGSGRGEDGTGIYITDETDDEPVVSGCCDGYGIPQGVKDLPTAAEIVRVHNAIGPLLEAAKEIEFYNGGTSPYAEEQLLLTALTAAIALAEPVAENGTELAAPSAAPEQET